MWELRLIHRLRPPLNSRHATHRTAPDKEMQYAPTIQWGTDA
jgi:hypothetical protein